MVSWLFYQEKTRLFHGHNKNGRKQSVDRRASSKVAKFLKAGFALSPIDFLKLIFYFLFDKQGSVRGAS